jgi:hypothetical protein
MTHLPSAIEVAANVGGQMSAGRFTVAGMAEDDLLREIQEKADAMAPKTLNFLTPDEASEDEAAQHVKRQLLDAGYDRVPDDYARELVRQAWAEMGK